MTNASPSCLDNNDNNKKTKGAAWTAAEVDASRRMALARWVCGMLPTLEGRGDKCLVPIAAHQSQWLPPSMEVCAVNIFG